MEQNIGGFALKQGKRTYTYASTFDTSSPIHGHCVYKNVWTPTPGDELEGRREGDNDFDRYAVAVLRRGVVVGHYLNFR